MNNGGVLKNRQRGFTLLELLVVLAIIGAMVGAAIFFAAPSATEEARRLGGQTFDLMNKARVSAMLERRIYGLELLDDDPEETELRLVVLASEVYGGGSYNGTAEDFESFDDYEHDADSFFDDEDTAADGEEGEPKITYADHVRKAQDLGLINWEGAVAWTELGDDDAVIIPGSVKLDFARETSLVDEARQAPPATEFPEEVADEEFPEEVEDIAPVVLFFPNGHLSNAGNFEFVSEAGDLVYSFSWNEEGDFERTDQD